MTGQSPSGPVRLFLRAPPHLPFVQGYPGITAGGNRASPCVKGSVEVRIGQTPVKAKWVRVEVRRYEVSPSGAPKSSANGTQFEHVGKVHILWKPSEGKEFDVLQIADFVFNVPLPLDIPPSVISPKGGSVRYELVAAVCYKGKGGIFKKDVSSYAHASEPLTITKYELASAWPVYNNTEVRSVSVLNGQVTLTVDRPSQAFGPGDRILLNASIKSNLPAPFRLKGFDMALVEVLTIYPPPQDAAKAKKGKPPTPPTVKRLTIGTSRAPCNIMVSQGGGDKGASLNLQIPTDKQLLTVRNAREFKVEYELVVEAACDGAAGKILLPGLECIVGTFSRSSAQQAVRDIGYVEGLCPRPPPGAHSQALSTSLSTSSVPSSPSVSSAATPLSEVPPRGHHVSASLSGLGRLGPPSGQPGLANARDFRLSMQPGPSPQPGARPPPGTGPGDLWRRSSSGTTSTTVTTTAGAATTPGSDFAPSTDRPFATLPAHHFQRNNVGFPSPQPNNRPHSAYSQDYLNGGHRSTSLTRVPDEGEETLSRDSTYNRIAQSDIGHGHVETQTNRLSDAGGTFGQWRMSEYQNVIDSAVRSGGSGPGPVSPGRAGWLSASNEKQRLYEEARGRAASAQQSHGATLSEIGLEGAGAPPGYAEPSRTTSPSVSVDSSAATSSAPPPVPPPALSLRSPATMKPEYLSAAQEKELQRQRFEAASGRVGGGSFGNAGSSSAPAQNGTPQRAASPLAASSTQQADEPIPYDDIFGSSSAGPSQGARPPVPAPYKSAAEEKDEMRARYEQAQQRVAHTQGAASPQQSSPAASNNGHAAGSSPGPSNGHPPAAFMSAVDEKEMMRRRYEDATNRVAGAGRPTSIAADPRANGSPGPSSTSIAAAAAAVAASIAAVSTPPPMAPAYLSAAEEKEMMRRRFEDAQSAVARTQGGGSARGSSGPSAAAAPPAWTAPPPASPPAAWSSPPPASPPTASPPVLSPAFMSAAEEKEMMRKRFEEAQSAVARTQGGPSAGGSGSSAAPAPVSPPPSFTPTPASPPPSFAPTYMSAADEKDLMRQRYEEATGRVSHATGASSSAAGGSAGPSVGSSAPSTMAPAYMSAADEKEMMRKRFDEAQSRVARTQGTLSSPPSSPPLTAASSPFTPPITASTFAPAYLSAEEEKDQMRRRYEEATGRVANGSNAGGSSSSSGPGPSSSSSPLAPAYMSAADEKDMMKRRYEEARSRSTGGSISSPPPLSSSPPPISYDELTRTASPVGSLRGAPGYMSAGDEKDAMRRRYEAARSASTAGPYSPGPSSAPPDSSMYRPLSPVAGETPLSLARHATAIAAKGKQRAMSALPDGPPPPVPSRPPREYTTLI
ncbi:hypothetical protein Q8F55_003986 [Vanrija albida]|uniref:Arrestin C-terminal-like domain-containing protein n=1 Tax=Vanrija albida TaxID=181172 RepID=A0ABR3Q5P8_9TREE